MASPNLAAEQTGAVNETAMVKNRFATWDALIFYGTLGVLLFGPLAFGAVESWAIFSLQLAITLLLSLWVARQFIARQLVITWNPLFAPIAAFAALVGVQLALRTSSYRHDTVAAALLYVVYAGLVFLVAQTLQRTSQAKRMAWLVTVYGGCIALFAILHSLSSNGKLYWLRTPRSGGWVYGPYVNHNHYAGLMEMLFPVALVTGLSRHVRGAWKAIPAAATVLMASSIFLSGSRGGMVAFLAQMVLLGIFIAGEKNRRTALTAGLVLTVVACLMMWVGGEALVNRMTSIHAEAKTELDGGLRFTIDRDGLKMFAHRPLLGSGLGTFATVYPQYRSFYTDKFINQAHDDYLQVLVETGIAGFAMVIWFLALVFRHGLRKVNDWTLDYNGAAAVAALLGCTGILVHSFVDFNLQIPANAALFYLLCAIAAAPTQFTIPRRLRRRHRDASAPADGDAPPPEPQLLF